MPGASSFLPDAFAGEHAHRVKPATTPRRWWPCTHSREQERESHSVAADALAISPVTARVLRPAPVSVAEAKPVPLP